jgi:hypothetical protein
MSFRVALLRLRDSDGSTSRRFGDGRERILVRVDVDFGTVPTREGARVGDSEADIIRMYGDRVTVSPHKYTDGHYLTVRSSMPGDTLHHLIFETEKSVVASYRAGKLPPVAYVERCG